MAVALVATAGHLTDWQQMRFHHLLQSPRQKQNLPLLAWQPCVAHQLAAPAAPAAGHWALAAFVVAAVLAAQPAAADSSAFPDMAAVVTLAAVFAASAAVGKAVALKARNPAAWDPNDSCL